MFVFLSKFLPIFAYPVGAAAVLLVLYFLVYKRRSWQNGIVALALILIWLGGNRWVAYGLSRTLEWRYLPGGDIPSADVIVVLGGGTEPPQYPRPMVELNAAGDRLVYAAHLYNEGKAPNILVSGGSIEWLGTEEDQPASDMQVILSMMGVPEDVVWLQPDSQNTYEDALYTRQMLDQKGIQRVILVTSAMHMPRAVALFEKQGIQVIPAPTDFKLTVDGWNNLTRPDWEAQLINIFPNVSNLSLTTNVLKEYFGMVVYRLRGWI
ncbi:MAG: YdcF family protein [Chloroflexi bacterium]|nr:YdcF family protein [Anaerolineaceae bacterium]NMB87397.1 YdcF family protein [Chloroflexota bacterium]